MKFELIKTLKGIEMYDDVPCLPVELHESIGERYVGEEKDAWLLLDNFVRQIDDICPNLLDYGDVDYFDYNKCIIIKEWLEGNMDVPEPRLKELYKVLYSYISQAVELNTGVVIGL